MARRPANDLTYEQWGNIANMPETDCDAILEKVITNYEPLDLTPRGKTIHVFEYVKKNKLKNLDELNAHLEKVHLEKNKKALENLPADYVALTYSETTDILDRMGVPVIAGAYSEEDYAPLIRRIWNRTLGKLRSGKESKFRNFTIDQLKTLPLPEPGQRGKKAEFIWTWGTDSIPNQAPNGLPVDIQTFIVSLSGIEPIATVERGKSPRVSVRFESGRVVSMSLPQEYNALPPKEDKPKTVATPATDETDEAEA